MGCCRGFGAPFLCIRIDALIVRAGGARAVAGRPGCCGLVFGFGHLSRLRRSPMASFDVLSRSLFSGNIGYSRNLRRFFCKFRLSYYPHRVESFKEILRASFLGKCEHNVYGDFKQYTPGQREVPCYFIHVVKKTT